MTYEEFLRNWFVEKNGGGEYYDTYSTEEDSPWKVGWTRTEIVHDEENYTWIEPLADDEGYYWLTKEADGVKISVGIEHGEYGDITKISIEADGVDVANEGIGTIDAVDALLGTGLDAASKKAEELKKRKLVTVANLQKALEDYDERKGTAVEYGEPVEGKNKVFIDGRGRVYARRTELARQSGLDAEKSERQSADNRLSAEIAKKADKEHTHKAADITDLPNYARSVNGEEPDADGNVEIDIDAVVEVAELPAETKKKVYLVPEVTTEKTIVDCSSVESIMSAVADRVTGETGHSINSIEDFFIFAKKISPAEYYSDAGCSDLTVTLEIPGGITDDGHKSNTITVREHTVFPNDIDIIDEKTGATLFPANKGFTVYYFRVERVSFAHVVGEGYDSGFVAFYTKSFHHYVSPVSLPTSMYFGEDSYTPPAVYAKSVELATKEALSEATSGADEKATALGERIGAVETSVTTAKSDITAMKSDITTAKTNITAMKSNITEAQANITKAQGDIEAVTSEVETVKTDVAALETKVVRSVNGTEPDENGNVEVASSSGASGKNDTITVSDTDSAVSDDTGILSGESGENPKGLLRFAASKIWDYVRNKIRGVLGVDKVSNFIRLNYDVQCNESIENPGFKVDRFGNMATRNVRNGTLSFTSFKGRNVVSTNISEMYNSNYILIFEVTQGASLIERQILVQSKTQKSFSIIVYVTEEGSLIKINYTALPIYPM